MKSINKPRPINNQGQFYSVPIKITAYARVYATSPDSAARIASGLVGAPIKLDGPMTTRMGSIHSIEDHDG